MAAWILYPLSTLIFLPIAGAAAIALLPSPRLGKWIAMGTSLATLFISLLLLRDFDRLVTPAYISTTPFYFTETRSWIPILNIFYRLGIDGLSLLLIVLTTLLSPIAILASWKQSDRPRAFLSLILFLEGATIGAFASLDLVLFYVFWELLLLPVLFLSGIWGGLNRRAATLKFFIFTASGSLLLLFGILFLSHATNGSFNLLELIGHPQPFAVAAVLFSCFAIAFLIKVPIFLLHTWAPDIYSEAPPAATLLLAAVLSKLGIYGLLRFCFPLFGEVITLWQTPLALLSTVGIIYGSLVAWVEPNPRRLVAYTSMAHMGTVLLAIFSLNPQAIVGGTFHMIAHGLGIGGLVLGLSFLQDRYGSRTSDYYGGVASDFPLLAVCFFIVVLGLVGLPGTSGFVGEILALSGTFSRYPVLAIAAAAGVILSAVYMLKLYQTIFLWKPIVPFTSTHATPNVRLLLAFLPIVGLIIILGWQPSFVLSILERSSFTIPAHSPLTPTLSLKGRGSNTAGEY